MTQSEFERFMEGVEEAFNCKFNDTQTAFWHKAFNRVEFDVAERTIELFYNNCTKVRSVKPIDLLQYRHQASSELGKKKELIDCAYCKGTGLVFLLKKIKNMNQVNDYTIRCFCEAGSRLSSQTQQLEKSKIKHEYKFISGKGQHLVLATKEAFEFAEQQEIAKTEVESNDINKIISGTAKAL